MNLLIRTLFKRLILGIKNYYEQFFTQLHAMLSTDAQMTNVGEQKNGTHKKEWIPACKQV